MALYIKQFTKPYPEGYVDKPIRTTPETAKILNMKDGVFTALEDFLTSDDVGFKKGLTVGSRRGISVVGDKSVVVGYAEASGRCSLAAGEYTIASGPNSCAIGVSNTASGSSSAAFGSGCTAAGLDAFSNGYNCQASGDRSHAEGYSTKALGLASHAEGNGSEASEMYTHAEGLGSIVIGVGAHAEGQRTVASGVFSHSEGTNTTASGSISHAEGDTTESKGNVSHAEGSHTIASGAIQHVQGKYNIEDTENKYAHIVGNGTAKNIDGEIVTTRNNAHTLDWAGNAWYAGDVTTQSGASLNAIGQAESIDIDFSNYFT